jgi:LuxR family maltose regulon positive regulatory protein
MLATKLYIPPPRSKIVLRPRLIERLNEGLHGKLTLISAPAGFGKTTLVSEWVASCGRPVAWLSLDEGDNDSARFLTYLVDALQTIMANIQRGIFADRAVQLAGDGIHFVIGGRWLLGRDRNRGD